MSSRARVGSTLACLPQQVEVEVEVQIGLKTCSRLVGQNVILFYATATRIASIYLGDLNTPPKYSGIPHPKNTFSYWGGDGASSVLQSDVLSDISRSDATSFLSSMAG